MERKASVSIALAFGLLSIVNPQLSTCLAQGPLTPPGPPAPSMKTLDQIEARTPISSAPFTISNPGSYYLTQNLSVSTGDAITIVASGVTLDLNGFRITSTAASATGTAILIGSGLKNILIQNGSILSGVTQSGGSFSGGGFASGINFTGISPISVRVSSVTVSGCLAYGINVDFSGNSTLVESCAVKTAGNDGIDADVVRGSSALECGVTGIGASLVSDSMGEAIASGGTGIYASYMALNCFGFSSSGVGLQTVVAENCLGGGSNATGLYVFGTAQNCAGRLSISGKCIHGAQGTSIINCTTNGGSVGIYAEVGSLVKDCIARASSGDGFQFISNCLITGNNAYGNSSNGFHTLGSLNRIDGNCASGNGAAGFLWNNDWVGRNFSVTNTPNYSPSVGGGNTSPVQAASSATNPYANF